MLEKPHINLAIIGHVDHGKSTLVGRLLYETGFVSKAQIDAYRNEAAAKGKSTFEYAWVTDDLPEERERGVTIRTQIKDFETKKYSFVICDAPGHQDYIKNMIKGTQQADAAILLVDAREGVQPQTIEHLRLAKIFDLKELVVAVNKMDAANPPYSPETYENIKTETTSLLKQIGFKDNEYRFVPVSAYNGENITHRTKNLAWYSGKTLADVLDELNPPANRSNLPLRWPIHEVKRVPGVGLIPVGFVETGTMSLGDILVFEPGNYRAKVRRMQEKGKDISVAKPGQPVGLDIAAIGGWDKKKLDAGYVAGHLKNPPKVAKSFLARIYLFPEAQPYINVGYTPYVQCHEASVSCTIIELINKINKYTGEIEEKPASLSGDDLATVRFKPKFPFVIEEDSKFPKLGRFALREKKTIGAGVVLSVEN
jgi:elongation factor 1-alpha